MNFFFKFIYRNQIALPQYTKTFAYQPNPQLISQQQIPNADVPINAAPAFDYRKFFDFGFFTNTAAGFGGPQVIAPQPQQQYALEKRIHIEPAAAVSYNKEVER